MSHEIDTSNNRNNIAYVGETPWHGLGQQLTAGQDIDVWTREAGLDYTVMRTMVEYHREDVLHRFDDRHVLYRSDTGAPLSVVSKAYKIVQPAEVMEFFRDLTKTGGYELETAGVLSGGKRIWALAKIGDGANVIGQDRVRPYLLLATSFDGTLSTVAKFTAVRVVCHNTITMAVGSKADKVRQSEQDVTTGPVVSAVRVSHNDRFNAAKVRGQLGIALDAFDKFMIDSRLLANKELDPATADDLTYELIEPTISAAPGKALPDIRQSKGYRRIMELYSGAAIGAEMTEGPTAWAWLNSITQWVDHERGRNRNSGLDSAWFGQGAAIKTRALEMALGA